MRAAWVRRSGIFPTTRSSVVRGNAIVRSSTGNAFFGTGRGLEISRNTIIDATVDGIRVNGNGATVSSVTITENVVRTSPGVRTSRGISAQNGTFLDCVASQNRIEGASENYVLAPGWQLVP